MQALETDPQHALYVRAALEELLSWGPTEAQALIILNGLLRFHASPEARAASWRELAELHERMQDLLAGGEPGFDDLGDGLYVYLNRETAVQRAEADLEDALNATAGVSRNARPQAA